MTSTEPTRRATPFADLRALPGPPDRDEPDDGREFGSLDARGLPVPTYTAAHARAERNLQTAIRDCYDDGVLVPCQSDPMTWDADGYQAQEDVTRAALLCRTACPVLDRCTAFLATEPPVCGILAGRYVPHSTDRIPGAAVNRKDNWACAVAVTTEVAEGAEGGAAA
jgi:hypothetical protein